MSDLIGAPDFSLIPSAYTTWDAKYVLSPPFQTSQGQGQGTPQVRGDFLRGMDLRASWSTEVIVVPETASRKHSRNSKSRVRSAVWIARVSERGQPGGRVNPILLSVRREKVGQLET
jgi:hypothetical protein